MWSSSRRFTAPMTHTLLVSRHAASRPSREILRNVGSSRSPLLGCDSHSPSNRLYSSARMTLGKLAETARFTRRPEQTSRRALTARGDLERMRNNKLAKENGHKPLTGHSPSSARKKADRKMSESARPLRKEMGSKSKSEKLVCRYCGSDDLAPSFIKRRDRRCRKCFSKRYGSAAQARKAKVKK